MAKQVTPITEDSRGPAATLELNGFQANVTADNSLRICRHTVDIYRKEAGPHIYTLQAWGDLEQVKMFTMGALQVLVDIEEAARQRRPFPLGIAGK